DGDYPSRPPRVDSTSMQQPDTANFSDRLQTSIAQVFGQTLPALIGALVIVFAGYLLAKVLEKLTERGLRRSRLNQLLARGCVIQAVERSGTHVNPTRVLANLVFCVVMFTVILLAANALGLDSLANVVSTLVSYIPSVIAAIVIILVGIVLGGFVGGLIAASAGGRRRGPAPARPTPRGGAPSPAPAPSPASAAAASSCSRCSWRSRSSGSRRISSRRRSRSCSARSRSLWCFRLGSCTPSSPVRSPATGTSAIAASGPKPWRANGSRKKPRKPRWTLREKPTASATTPRGQL